MNTQRPQNIASAQDVSSEDVDNENVPEYFLAQEFLYDGSKDAEGKEIHTDDKVNENSIINQNTFLYFSEGTNENYLSLSLKTDRSSDSNNGIMDYVYHPNAEDASTFNFYHITNLTLFINGQEQELSASKTYIDRTDYSFENHDSTVTLDGFEMIFDRSGERDNAFSIMENGNVKEGVYTVSLTLLLFTCTDGDTNQETFLPEVPVTIDYSFYVLNRASYFLNNRPVLSKGAFDSEVTTSAGNTAYTLYSNYTSKAAAAQDENQIPYIEYDCTRFELDIRKELATEIKTVSLAYDKDFSNDAKTSPIAISGDDIVLTQVNVADNKCRVYFTDVGAYTITFKAIKLIPETVTATETVDGVPTQVTKTITHKYALDGMTSITKNVVVHMYGFQAGYTDFDKEADANNIRPFGEMKEVEKDNAGNLTGKFENGADITSKFVNFKPEYSQDNRLQTFTRRNIVDFLNTDKNGNIINNPTVDTQYALAPVKTNQTPVRFLSNAMLENGNTDQSYILTTNNLPGYATTTYSLHGQALYQKTFTGQAESAVGTYIYIIAYKYNNHTSKDRVFYQVFFFEIEKGTPSISVTTLKDGKDSTVYSNTFINQNVTVTDTTQDQPFNRDVTIRIYAYDYVGKTWMSEFGGVYGISMSALLENGDVLNVYDAEQNSLTLLANAHYYIRLYYTSELKSQNLSTHFETTTGFTSQQNFTIDAIGIEEIKGRNVTETTSGFQLLNDMQSFTTNQNLAISWKKKDSGASSYAYYRFFPLVGTQFYSQNENSVANLLGDMLGQQSPVLPVGSVLNLGANNNWIPLGGNTLSGGNTVDFTQWENLSSEYVLSQAGLYLIDIYDEAGNHKLDVFLIDNTSPIFALFNGETSRYELVSPTIYLNQTSTLYWADFKGIYISGLNTSVFQNLNPDNLQTSDLENASDNNLFLDRKKGISENSVEIYKLMYEKLYQSHMQFLTCANASSKPADVTSPLITSYTGMYLTIKINDVSYYADDTTQGNYVRQDSSTTHNRKEIVVKDDEITYRVLIRDLSNTKMELTEDENSTAQYTNHFSARQTVRVSFDDSKFAIKYNDGEDELSSFITEQGTVDGDATKRTLTTYLSPTSLEKAFTLSFIPTSIDSEGSTKTQVETVIVQYYRYITTYQETGGVRYYYSKLSDSAETYKIYDVAENGESDKEFPYNLGISNTEQITNPGKYVITRTYKVDDGYTYNQKDFYQRTLVLIVDRNKVITSPETVDDGHAESLVGGDIFVAMFDNGISSSLVVTAPNSDQANTDGKAIYDGRLLLTTNKLPLNIYVPQYKYTTHVNPIKGSENYDFSVENNDKDNHFKDDIVIREYALFAELYVGGTNANNLIAKTAFQNYSNPGLSDIQTENGFLKFYRSNGQELEPITEAGQYYVKIYQGRFGTETGENSYNQSITFGFEIKSATPNFTAQLENGSALKSDTSSSNEYSEIYYTNQSEISLLWEASTDNYMVQIDVDKISLKTKNGTTYTSASDIWTVRPYEQDNHTYLAQLNLERLSEVYQNDGWVDITMQFENQDDQQKIYKPITKRIYVDLSAPNSNINSLVGKSLSNNTIIPLTESALRVYQTAKFQTATDFNNTSYNISNSNGTFANYSYSVTSQFLQTLKSSKEHLTYIRKFINGRYVQGEEGTTPSSFSPNNFDEVDSLSSLEANAYYEVVETDKAGNMTIYTIYVADYQSTENLLSYNWADNTTGTIARKGYTKEEYDLVKAKNGAIHNIYSKTGFTLSDINFFGDEWAQMTLTTFSPRGDRTTRTLMLTPYDKGYALMFVGNATPVRIAISSLIDGSVSSIYKNCLSIYNRENGATENFYINIRNTSLSASLTEQQDDEYIRFSKVADTQIQDTTRASTYLTQLSITAYDSASNVNVIYDSENPLGYASDWSANTYISVDNTNNLTFRVRPEVNFVSNNTRIVYHYVDNYGTQYSEIHIYRETVISKEVTSNKDIYSFTDSNGTLFYVTNGDFQYIFNPSKYEVRAFSLIGGQQTDLTGARVTSTANIDGTRTFTVASTRTTAYNNSYVLEIRDANSAASNNLIKRVYFILYNQLPTPNTDNGAGRFWMLDANGSDITNDIVNASTDQDAYFSEVRIMYNLSQANNSNGFAVPVKFSVSTDQANWTEISSGTRLRSQTDQMEKYYLKVWYDEKYLPNENGGAQFVFGNVPKEQIFEFNLSALTATYWVEKTVDGVTTIVQKSGSIFQAASGMQYTNHYLVDLDYSQRSAVEIKVNQEQSITKTLIEPLFVDGSVTSELWLITNNGNAGSNIPAFETYIVISYIPPSDNFVEEFYASNANGIIESENLITKTSSSVIIPPQSNVDRVQLQWSKYYGLSQNEIDITIEKDGMEFKPQIYTRRSGEKQYNYTYLTYSGKYTISFKDQLGNAQKFNMGNSGQTEEFTFIFLKDVPFSVTYNNPQTQQEETSLPIKQAIYNSAVTISIDESARSEFFSLGLSAYPKINVKKNGVNYEGNFSDNATSFTFTESGYYEIFFTTTLNNSNEEVLRSEPYQFTILNPEEHKISYVYNQYSNYYVERVLKNGQDITAQLLTQLDVAKINVDGKQYLAQLPLSYLDDKTGEGAYTITINSNNQLFKNSSLATSWTYQVKINRGTAPLDISLGEGKSTTKQIFINFSQENVYAEMGECTLRVVRQNDNNTLSIVSSTAINANSTGNERATIDQNGTFYVQIVSPSGALMFSYKVTKTAPMNAASIIAIVISAVVLIAVIFIIIKLRKRISVK